MKKNYDYKIIAAELSKDPLDTINTAFALMFVIPMLVVLYLLIGKYQLYSIVTGINSILWLICIALSLAGFFVSYIMVKKVTLKMLQYSSECRKSEELKTALISEVSHDFRTPLTTIKINISALQNITCNVFSDTHHKMLNLCLTATDKLIQFVTVILDESRLNLIKVSMKRERIDFKALLQEEIDLILPQVNQRLQKLSYVKNNDYITVWGDRLKLRRVLSNLLSNAVKHTQESGEIKIALNNIGETAMLDIVNTGKGITKDNLDKIFDKYYQIDKDSKDGIGLGLSIAKEIVQMHKGKIEVSSRLGEETKFSIFLPQDLRESRR
jgi:signal transduction histidine kinase